MTFPHFFADNMTRALFVAALLLGDSAFGAGGTTSPSRPHSGGDGRAPTESRPRDIVIPGDEAAIKSLEEALSQFYEIVGQASSGEVGETAGGIDGPESALRLPD